MGVKTQLFINIEDANGEQILGTVIQYQWGYGKVMLESALDIATNMDSIDIIDDGKSEEQTLYKLVLCVLLKKYCGFKKPELTYALRNEIEKYICCSGGLIISTADLNALIADNELAVKEPAHDFQKAPCRLFSVDDPVERVRRAYMAKYNNFFNQCENNGGLMFINMRTAEPIERLSLGHWNVSEIKLGFGLTTDTYEKHPKWHPSTFNQYARQIFNRNVISDKYIENYERLLKKNRIEMMSPDELHLRRKEEKLSK
ncbi:hypothetical protein [Lactobacillus apis]|nr:hypothetical protein [Lactobacillus apis]